MRKLAMILALATLAGCESSDVDSNAEASGAAEVPITEQGEEIAAESPVGLLGVDTLPAGGAFLTDAAGRALYTLEDEDEPSACVDACATAWPPYTRTATEELAPSVLGVGLDPELIGSVQRPDGTEQVTYDGQPLYFYARDTAPGQAAGHDVTDEWGEWYLVQPSGELLHE